jgi:hypothetical protein
MTLGGGVWVAMTWGEGVWVATIGTREVAMTRGGNPLSNPGHGNGKILKSLLPAEKGDGIFSFKK